MLRTDLFETVERASTRFIAVRDTLTPSSPLVDARAIDIKSCRQGRLGIGVHLLLTTEGDIQLGRDIETVGSHSRSLDATSVAVGVVGGLDDEGNRTANRTPDQLEALVDVLECLSERYPDAVVDDAPFINAPL